MTQALLDPVVVRPQVAAPTGAGKGPAVGVDGTDTGNELGEVMGEAERCSRIGEGGGDAEQPCLDGPRQGIADTGLTQGAVCGVAKRVWPASIRAASASERSV